MIMLQVIAYIMLTNLCLVAMLYLSSCEDGSESRKTFSLKHKQERNKN